MKIAVIGAGSWGTALARLLYYNGHTVKLWSHRDEHVAEMCADGENRRYLPNVILPSDMVITSNLSNLSDSELVVFAVPSTAVVDVAHKAKSYLSSGVMIVNVAKGFIPNTLQRISEVLHEVYPFSPIATLSGPSHAEEVSRDIPTAVCVAATDSAALLTVQDVFISRSFRVYTNDDLIGVEIGGAVKNIIAVSAGVSDGLGYGDNTKAALVTRGLAEMKRFGTALGADPGTFSGLAGVGDLFVTCTSLHSRNYRAGRQIGRGKPWHLVVEEMGMVVEGVYATECTYKLAKRYGVEMPITEQIYRLLYENKSPQEALWELMTRQRTQEL